MKCNGEYNCVDFSDEEHCNITCAADEFKCPGHNFCIPNVWVCDGKLLFCVFDFLHRSLWTSCAITIKKSNLFFQVIAIVVQVVLMK